VIDRVFQRLARGAPQARQTLRRVAGVSALGGACVYALVAPGAHPQDQRVILAVAVLLGLVGVLILARRRSDIVRTSLAALTAAAFAIGLSQYQPGAGGLGAFNLAVPPGVLLLIFMLSEEPGSSERDRALTVE